MILALEGNPEAATAKRYLYALRSLLAGAHVLRFATPAPVAFNDLLDSANLSREHRDGIDAMVVAKSGGKESDAIGAQSMLNEFLKNEHQSLSAALDQMPEKIDVDSDAFDQIFRDLIED